MGFLCPVFAIISWLWPRAGLTTPPLAHSRADGPPLAHIWADGPPLAQNRADRPPSGPEPGRLAQSRAVWPIVYLHIFQQTATSAARDNAASNTLRLVLVLKGPRIFNLFDLLFFGHIFINVTFLLSKKLLFCAFSPKKVSEKAKKFYGLRWIFFGILALCLPFPEIDRFLLTM